ncbi:TIM-barrel domain-containing protein [Polaribacter tangerinus]|uniref:TIM-barrel domain-containing protein n=1 Tax=Polaribacter tangerinus TaxID=1920034 RepID=UPI000B4BD4E9|nr:TIM-barrel domain-containing protein [Polaribacter tangerinus]
MKTIKIVIIVLFLSAYSWAQNSGRIFKDAKFLKGNKFEIAVSDGNYIIQFYSDKIVETLFVPTYQTVSSASHAVVLSPQKISININETANRVTYASNGIKVVIDKKPFKISYFYRGALVTSEKRGYYISDHIPLEAVKENIIAAETEKIEFNLSESEVLYGTGSRALGMNRRGHRLPLFNKAHYGYENYSELMNFTLPIVISSKKYMLHFDNAPVGYLDLDSKKDNSLTYETISGTKKYQVIVGNSWENLIDNYTKLTGKQPLPPRWALGNFSSRFGYHSQAETERTIAKFNEENIPVDAVILDLYWFGKDIQGTMGNLEVFKDSFPDMKGMISNFKKKGVKTILITEPFILSNSKRWDEATKENILAKDSVGNPAKYDFYFGNTGIIDIYKKEGKVWFWNIYKDILNMGVKGLWGDLGEPEVHPHWVQHQTGSANEVHNTYGHDWAKLIYEGYKRDYSNERPFILMRSGAAGSQRFGMIPWSGDVSRTWGGLESQPEIALQMGLQGFGYMHSDLGGFAGSNLDDNLYVRWLQYGVFQPIFRPHAQEDVASEPVYRSDNAKSLSNKAIELRYQLLPYNYNLAFENHTKGTPLMRPIFFEEETKEMANYSKSYLWGKDFLITPILKDSVVNKEIYFPKTNNWFNFYTDNKVKGGVSKEIILHKNYIPTYVRAGAFILTTPIKQSTDFYTGKEFMLHYYHDDEVITSKRTFYNDNGTVSNPIEKGVYEILSFQSTLKKNFLKFNFNATLGKNWQASSKTIEIKLHNITWVPKKVLVNGKKTSFNLTNNVLSLSVNWNTNKSVKIKIATK